MTIRLYNMDFLRIVMLELPPMVRLLEADEEAFADLLARKTNKELLAEQRIAEGEMQKAIARSETVARMYEKLYEDNANGKLSNEWFMQLSHKYEVERMELKAKIAELRKKLADMGWTARPRDILSRYSFVYADAASHSTSAEGTD